jgi:phage shock protein PspC (stress-responsive transcriptional regulator)
MTLPDELLKLDQLRERGVLTPAEFEQAKRRLLEASPVPPAVLAVNRFRRCATDRWLAGVCGGVARQTGVEAWVWRLAFTLLFFVAGTGVLLYLLLWIFVPDDAVPSPGSPTQPAP